MDVRSRSTNISQGLPKKGASSSRTVMSKTTGSRRPSATGSSRSSASRQTLNNDQASRSKSQTRSLGQAPSNRQTRSRSQTRGAPNSSEVHSRSKSRTRARSPSRTRSRSVTGAISIIRVKSKTNLMEEPEASVSPADSPRKDSLRKDRRLGNNTARSSVVDRSHRARMIRTSTESVESAWKSQAKQKDRSKFSLRSIGSIVSRKKNKEPENKDTKNKETRNKETKKKKSKKMTRDKFVAIPSLLDAASDSVSLIESTDGDTRKDMFVEADKAATCNIDACSSEKENPAAQTENNPTAPKESKEKQKETPEKLEENDKNDCDSSKVFATALSVSALYLGKVRHMITQRIERKNPASQTVDNSAAQKDGKQKLEETLEMQEENDENAGCSSIVVENALSGSANYIGEKADHVLTESFRAIKSTSPPSHEEM